MAGETALCWVPRPHRTRSRTLRGYSSRQHSLWSLTNAPVDPNVIPLTVDRRDADRVETVNVEFAYRFDHETHDGSRRITTTPLN